MNGLLCQADFTPIAIFPTTTANVFQVMNWRSDFELATVPYYEVFDDTPSSTNGPVAVQITNPQPQTLITIQPIQSGTSFSSFPNPKLRRIITYLHVPPLALAEVR